MESNGILLVAIINKGYSDLVMEAAKISGARGGTIFNARGTGNKEMGEFFGVPIQPEKEIVLILVENSIKDKCLLNIYKNAGLETRGQGIVFALPVEDMLGLMPLDLKEEEK